MSPKGPIRGAQRGPGLANRRSGSRPMHWPSSSLPAGPGDGGEAAFPQAEPLVLLHRQPQRPRECRSPVHTAAPVFSLTTCLTRISGHPLAQLRLAFARGPRYFGNVTLALRASISTPSSPNLGTWPIRSTRIRSLIFLRFLSAHPVQVQWRHRSGDRPARMNSLRLAPKPLDSSATVRFCRLVDHGGPAISPN